MKCYVDFMYIQYLVVLCILSWCYIQEKNEYGDRTMDKQVVIEEHTPEWALQFKEEQRILNNIKVFSHMENTFSS